MKPYVCRRAIGVCASLLSAGALLALATPASAAPSSTPDATYVTNGQVTAVARLGNTIYLGGLFSEVGPRTGPLVGISETSGAVIGTVPQVSGGQAAVEAVVSDGAGGEYIGGDFTHVGAVPRSNVAHILADGAVDPAWNPDANGEVEALALSDGTVYLGGDFHGADSINGTQTRNYAAAVDATTGIDTGWNPDANNQVLALAVSGSLVYLGGEFSGADSINGTATRDFVAAVGTLTGNVSNTWNPGADNAVVALAVSNAGTVYLGGAFTQVDGQPRNAAAAVSTSGTLSSTWNPDPNASVDALAVSGSTVYLGGVFHGPNSINANTTGVTRNYVAAVDATSGVATGWDPDPNNGVDAIAVSGGTVYLGGYFHGSDSINANATGVTRNYLAAVDATTAVATSWDPNANNIAFALAVSGEDVVAGGYFSSLGGVARNNVAAINAADGTPTAWDPDAHNWVNAIAVSGSTVYLGGEFSGNDSINANTTGVTRNDVAAVDATSGVATSWNPDASSYVFALAISGSTVYLGGDFNGPNSINANTTGVTRNRAAAVDATTGVATGWDPDANGDVAALAVSGSTVYLGGQFNGPNSINANTTGVTRNYAAAVDATNGAATAWDPDANNVVVALAVSGSTVYLGGDFTGPNSINANTTGVTRNYAAAVDATSGVATGWDPDANSYVDALAVSGGTVYLGGYFNGSDSINANTTGVTRNYVAAVDATSGVATAWNPNPNGTVYALLAAPDGSIYVVGYFSSLDSVAQSEFASFSEPPANTSLPQITGTAAAGRALACSTGSWSGSTPQTYAYQWLRNGSPVSGATGSSIVLAPSDAGHEFACTVTAANLSGVNVSATSLVVSVSGAAGPVVSIPNVLKGRFTINARTGVVTFSGTLSASGTLHWRLTFPNGRFGVFAAKKLACAKGTVKLSGKCRPASVAYSRGSTTATKAGAVRFTARPSAAAKRALEHALAKHESIRVSATLSFQPAHGGSGITHTQTITIKPKQPKGRKHATELDEAGAVRVLDARTPRRAARLRPIVRV